MLAINAAVVTVPLRYFFIAAEAPIENFNGFIISFLHLLILLNSRINLVLLPLEMLYERSGKLSSFGTPRFEEEEIANTL